MGNELTNFSNKGMSLVPKTLEEATNLATILSQSSIVPFDFRGKPGDVLVAMMMGGEVGLSPIQSLQNIAVINGRPCIWGDSAKALVMVHSDFEWSNEGIIEDKEIGLIGWVEVKRKNNSVLRVEFTQLDAVKAGLWGNVKKDPWIKYPKAMLLNRARAFAFRNKFPDALRGLSIREEVEDYTDVEYTVTTDNNKEKKTEKIVDNGDNVTTALSSTLGDMFNKKEEDKTVSGDDLIEMLADEFDATVTNVTPKNEEAVIEPEIVEEVKKDDSITESERRMLYARIKEAGITPDAVKEKFNIEHIKGLSKTMLNDVIEFIKEEKERVIKEKESGPDRWTLVYAKIINHFGGEENKSTAHAFIKKAIAPFEIKRVGDLANLPTEKLDDLDASISWEIQLASRNGDKDLEDLLD